MSTRCAQRTGRLLPWMMLSGALTAACSADSPVADEAGPVEGGLVQKEAGDGPLDSTSEQAADAQEESNTSCADLPEGLPSDVFCTGLYEGRDSTLHAASAMPYLPGVTLWSDGAEKQRFLYLPPSTKIDTTNMDAWSFPVGTKAWKEFRVDGALIETRLFWKRTEALWASGTYIWDSSQKSATLNTSRQPVLLSNGYEIPTAKDCGKCHHGGADKLLGVEAVALGLPKATGATLQALVAAGSLSTPPRTTSVQLPDDGTGKAAAAIGYLHANCGMACHSLRGLGEETQLVLRVRADEVWPSDVQIGDAASDAGASIGNTDVYRATIGVTPTTAAVAQAFPGALRISPGAHDKSLVWLLSHLRGNYQMPPLVSHKIDDVGTKQLADWIDSLPLPP